MIVVEVKQRLRAQDFDSLAFTADAWIEAHGDLQGLVIHAREFPGWENLGAFLRHVRFLRNHHRKVKRIAFAVDSKLASLAPKIAEHFVQAEIKVSRTVNSIAPSRGHETLRSQNRCHNDPLRTEQNPTRGSEAAYRR